MEQERKQIKQSTKDGYDSRLKMLNKGKPVDNYAFLYDIDVVMQKISHLSPGTQRNYIISIVQALRDVPVMKNMLAAYTELMNKFNAALKVNDRKSKKQVDNWATQDEIDAVYKKVFNENIDLFCSKKKSITELDWDRITETILLALYILQPPRRILDYTAMVIVKSMPAVIDKAVNYYDLSTDTFVFNNYKTAGTYDSQVLKAPSRLATLLECYAKIHVSSLVRTGSIPMLCLFSGESYTKSYAITRILNRTFKKELDIKISVSMLRNIYLTSKFGPQVALLANTATAMGTSSSTIQNNYIKID
jgi:hypothetical protein